MAVMSEASLCLGCNCVELQHPVCISTQNPCEGGQACAVASFRVLAHKCSLEKQRCLHVGETERLPRVSTAVSKHTECAPAFPTT